MIIEPAELNPAVHFVYDNDHRHRGWVTRQSADRWLAFDASGRPVGHAVTLYRAAGLVPA